MTEKNLKFHEPMNECHGKAFQMDDHGNFRIVVHGIKSNWTTYKGITQLEYDGHRYAGVSAYYEGELPHECVFEIIKTNIVDSEEEKAPEYLQGI